MHMYYIREIIDILARVLEFLRAQNNNELLPKN